jgi:hypothetical protein
MDHFVQDAVVALLVVGALTYLTMRIWRAVRAARARTSGGCGPGCGCD